MDPQEKKYVENEDKPQALSEWQRGSRKDKIWSIIPNLLNPFKHFEHV